MKLATMRRGVKSSCLIAETVHSSSQLYHSHTIFVVVLTETPKLRHMKCGTADGTNLASVFEPFRAKRNLPPQDVVARKRTNGIAAASARIPTQVDGVTDSMRESASRDRD